jgi:hypothetical protein
VVDGSSVIVTIEYSLDADEWLQVFPEDQIFDALEESFRFTIEAETPRREHSVLVRAADEQGNQTARRVVVP